MGILSSIIGIIIILCNLLGAIFASLNPAAGIVSGSVFIVGGLICSQISKATKNILESLEKGHTQRIVATKSILESLGKKTVQNDTVDTTKNTIKDLYI